MSESSDQDLRQRALSRIKKRREFGAHLLAYVTVNAFIIAIWALAAGGGFFWPMFPLLGWGIGLLFHAWDVYLGEPTEAEIDREIEHLRRRST